MSSNKQEREMKESVAQKNATQQVKKGFRLRTYDEVKEDADKLPPAIRLFGDLIYKEELTIICGDTNTGKSILASQISIGMTEGKEAITGFGNESEACKVVYADLELSDRQFAARLGEQKYSDKLIRMDNDPDCSGCSIGIEQIMEVSKDKQIDVFVIDNITAVLKDPAKEAEIAIKMMDDLTRIKKEDKKTIIALTHIPKRYDTTPLTNDHISGSKSIANFADAVFFIAKSSKGSQYRYLKQTKGRNSLVTDRVFVLELKKGKNGLYFDLIGTDEEENHLFRFNQKKSERKMQMEELRNQGYSMEIIAEQLGINKSTVSRTLAKKDNSEE